MKKTHCKSDAECKPARMPKTPISPVTKSKLPTGKVSEQKAK